MTTAADLADADDELVVLHVMTREIAANAGVDGDVVVPKGRVGSPAEEIVDTAERTEPRYLVLGGHKRSTRRCSAASRSRCSSRSRRRP